MSAPDFFNPRVALGVLHARGFIGYRQAAAMAAVLDSEEAQFMMDKIREIYAIITGMPKTYEQDGMGDQAVVHLHYFLRGMDWHITEKDMEDEQLQAFGLADLGYGPELGYIWLGEITEAGAELDLYWTPKTLAEVKGAQA